MLAKVAAWLSQGAPTLGEVLLDSPTKGGAPTVDRLSSLWVRLRLFVSSFAPLWAIIALRQEGRSLTGVFALLAIAGVLSALLIVVDVHRLTPSPRRVASVDDRGADVAGYLATYLLPFVMASAPSGRDLAAYALFVGVIAAVYIQSNMLAVNPILYFAGLRVYWVTTESGFAAYLISRDAPEPGSTILTAELGDGVLVETRRRS